MKPLKNNIIYRKEVVLGGQASSIIIEMNPEFSWIVEAVGPQVKYVKVGDRMAIRTQPKLLNDDKYLISEDDVLGVYSK